MDKLQSVIELLNTIPVAGIENFQKIIACINTLKEVQNECNRNVKTDK